MKNFCIYCHINKINKKRYIGQTCQKVNLRWRNGNGYKNCPRFYSAICHYGWDNFDHIILEENLSQQEADQKEIYYINFYQSNDPDKGYNMTIGGNTLAIYYQDEEHRKEQSIRRKQYFLDHPDKKQENDKRIKQISIQTAEQRSKKMKENYNNKQGLYEINKKRKRKIKCVETGEKFDSLTAASKAYNISVGNISMVINGKRHIAGGYHWIEENQ